MGILHVFMTGFSFCQASAVVIVSYLPVSGMSRNCAMISLHDTSFKFIVVCKTPSDWCKVLHPRGTHDFPGPTMWHILEWASQSCCKVLHVRGNFCLSSQLWHNTKNASQKHCKVLHERGMRRNINCCFSWPKWWGKHSNALVKSST